MYLITKLGTVQVMCTGRSGYRFVNEVVRALPPRLTMMTIRNDRPDAIAESKADDQKEDRAPEI
jgi:hypothetical protein